MMLGGVIVAYLGLVLMDRAWWSRQWFARRRSDLWPGAAVAAIGLGLFAVGLAAHIKEYR